MIVPAKTESGAAGWAISLTAGLALTACSISAEDWYWINDFGGTWNEMVGGRSSWRNSGGTDGLPAIGDDALLVLPYSMSFPGFTQPVVVNFRSAMPLSLDELVIESENWLVQDDALGTPLSELNLTVGLEIIGGSSHPFDPPASFPLPDPPGIFPVGRHLHRAGTNHVSRLLIGIAEGSDGTYELSETGVLQVRLGEMVGDHGTGDFVQTGGTHTAGALTLGSHPVGDGTYTLEGGNFSVISFLPELYSVAVGYEGAGHLAQSGGSFVADAGVYLGHEPGSHGDCSLTGGTMEMLDLSVGSGGIGHLTQSGDHRLTVTRWMILGEEPGSEGNYQLFGSARLDGFYATIGRSGRGRFTQRGGEFTLSESLSLGSHAGGDGEYTLESGTLTAESAWVGFLGDGHFHQQGGTFQVTAGPFYLGTWFGYETGGTGTYLLEEGNLNNTGYLQLGGPAAATFTQTGGVHDTHRVHIGGTDAFATSRYVLEDGALNTRFVEIQRHGRFEQAGGIARVYETLDLNHDLAVYALEGGVLEVGTAGAPVPIGFLRIIGDFEQSGAGSEVHVHGRVACEDLGYCHLEDGLLEISGDFEIGVNGSGSFYAQDGGTASAERVIIGNSAGGGWLNGHLFFDGGTLTVSDHILIESGSEISINGGRLEVDEVLNHGYFRYTAGEIASHTLGLTPYLDNQPDGFVRFDSAMRKELYLLVDNYGECWIFGEFIVRGLFINHGLVKVHDGSRVGFIDMFLDHGHLDIDPATVTFHDDLVISEAGYVTAGAGDTIIVEGDFLNASTQVGLWNTAHATLVMAGSGVQRFELPGEERGDTIAGRVDNFAWGRIEVRTGAQVEFVDGNPDNAGTALYVGVLHFEDPAVIDTDNRILLGVSGDITIRYDASRPENAVLGGLNYTFASGTGGVVAETPTLPGVRCSIALLEENNALEISFPSVPGRTYGLLHSPDLVAFSPVAMRVATEGSSCYTLPLSRSGKGFFRVVPLANEL